MKPLLLHLIVDFIQQKPDVRARFNISSLLHQNSSNGCIVSFGGGGGRDQEKKSSQFLSACEERSPVGGFGCIGVATKKMEMQQNKIKSKFSEQNALGVFHGIQWAETGRALGPMNKQRSRVAFGKWHPSRSSDSIGKKEKEIGANENRGFLVTTQKSTLAEKKEKGRKRRTGAFRSFYFKQRRFAQYRRLLQSKSAWINRTSRG